VQHFLGPGWDIEPEAMARIEAYSWPGNVRQLINALERAKILADGRRIRLKDLPKEVVQATGGAVQPSPASVLTTDDLATLQRHKIVEVLRREAANKSRAARALGIDRRKLYRLLEKYQITDGEIAAASDGNAHAGVPPASGPVSS